MSRFYIHIWYFCFFFLRWIRLKLHTTTINTFALTIFYWTETDWVVSSIDKARYDVIFSKSDLDKDGLVSGGEIKGIFVQSGIPQMCLAQIWALCDTNQSGKLTAEQFALAMWLVERKKKNGIEPPNVLAPNMVPPSKWFNI